jgi:hypothetical protein
VTLHDALIAKDFGEASRLATVKCGTLVPLFAEALRVRFRQHAGHLITSSHCGSDPVQ